MNLSTSSHSPNTFHNSLPNEDSLSLQTERINPITLNEPWKWLKLGWEDIKQAPQYSLAYGGIFVLFGYLIVWGLYNSPLFLMIVPLTAGLFLLAPILAIGLYAISRALEQGEALNLNTVTQAWQRNGWHIAFMGLILMFILLFWMLTANVVFALFYDRPVPEWSSFIQQVFFSGENVLFLLMSFLSGGILAFFTFCISVISIPMLMDRQVTFIEAIGLSISAIKKNTWPLLLWAYLIVMYIGIGLLTFFIGLLITMPLIGHASWHAYKELVKPE